MKSLLSTALMLTLVVGGVARGQEQIPWAADFRQACEQAAQQRKLVLLHFYADDCPPCVRVEQNVFSRPEVAASIARSYVPVKVHAMQNRELAERYQVTRWPTDVAVTPAGLEVHRSTSPQAPEQYIELVNLMALKAGVGTDKQWAVNMEQVGQATLGPAAAMAQNMSAQGQQQWNLVSQQVAGGAEQARAGAAQWSQQAQDAAHQFGQQSQNAVQQYQAQAQEYQAQAQGTAQQFQGAAQQFQGQATETAQRFGQQSLAAGQQVQNSAQQFGAAARGAIAPWQANPAGDLRAPQFAAPQTAVPQNAAPQDYGPAVAARQAPVGVVGSTASPTGMTNPFFGQQPAAPPATSTAWQPPPQQNASAASPQFVPASQAPPICLDGFCPVTLLETKKWKKADPQFGAVHRGRTYLFADADQQKKFLANPDGFAPVLSGYDPVRFATTGQLVEGSRAFGVITPGDNRIFLFADKASLEQFERTPRAFAEPAYQAMQRSETAGSLR